MNLRKQQDIRLVSNGKSAERLVAKPNFNSFEIINEDLTMIKMKKVKILWNKPTYVEFTILDLSKLHMYKFHYDTIRSRYGPRAKLLFTDTDSLCYEFQTDDVYSEMTDFLDQMDTSNYPADYAAFSKTNDKVIGKFKDECEGIPPLQFVGLKAKMYSILLPNNKEKTTAKGIKTSYIKQNLTHATFLNTLQNQTQTMASFHAIRSVNHTLKTIKINKKCLNAFDDKHYHLHNCHDTLAYGHYKIRQLNDT